MNSLRYNPYNLQTFAASLPIGKTGLFVWIEKGIKLRKLDEETVQIATMEISLRFRGQSIEYISYDEISGKVNQ